MPQHGRLEPHVEVRFHAGLAGATDTVRPGRFLSRAAETFIPSPTKVAGYVRQAGSAVQRLAVVRWAAERARRATAGRGPRPPRVSGSRSRRAHRSRPCDRQCRPPPRRPRSLAGVEPGPPASPPRQLTSTRSCGVTDEGDHQQAKQQARGDGADRVGRVDSADQSPGVLTSGGNRR